MKKLLISAFALGLAAAMPTALWAQDEHHDQSTDHPVAGQGDETKPDDTDKTKHDSTSDKTTHTDKAAGGAAGDAAMTAKDKDIKTRTRNGRTTTNTGTTKDTTSRTRDDKTTTTNGNTHRTKVDVTTYRKTVTATHHYNAGAYRAPPGYSYRRYGVGERLPTAFFARDFWLTDYASYGLIAPPGDGYVWVRFGPDALLIDEDTGETVQVVYGVFE
jgi:Ni/Co efflux regulator RcnB